MRIILLCICFSFNLLLFSQEAIKWGKPTDSEKNLKICVFDSVANAVILSEHGSINIASGYAYIHIYRKIKILNPNGIIHANIQIPFYHKDNLEEVKDVKAQTINIENGLVSKIELNKKDIFTKIHNSRWSDTRFTFPSVKEGSILEYQYTLVTQRITFLDAWIFQHEIPAIYSEIKVDFPPDLKYSIIFFGDELMTKYDGKENPDNFWALNNITGYENEENVFCYEDYVEKLQFQLQSYQVWEGGGYAKGLYDKDILKTWDQLAEDVSEEYKKYLNKTSKAAEILDTLINASDTRDDKIKKIYWFANSYINWDKDYYIFTGKSMNELLESRQGNSSEVNLLLCLLLNEAGIKSYPVLISTKSHGKITKDYPLLDQFNHIIVAIENNEGFKLVDATGKSKNCFQIPFEDLNYYGFLLDKIKWQWIDIQDQLSSKENSVILCKFDSSSVSMQVKNTYSGYYALNRRNLAKEQSEKQPGILSFGANMLFVTDSSNTANLDNEYADYSESFYCSSGFNSGNKIFINLNSNGIVNPFKKNERLFPIEFDFLYSKQKMYVFTLPDGYVAKVLPANLAISLPDNAGKFIYNSMYSGNQLTIMIKQDIKKSIMQKEYYGYLKEFYNQMVLKLNEPIVLEKLL